MASALDSFDKSLTHFTTNVYGLGMDVQYINTVTNITYDHIRVVLQTREGKTQQRKITNGKQVDYEVMLITLPFVPQKNDKIIKDSVTFYIDRFETVSLNNYRVYCEAGEEKVPSPMKRVEI